MFTLRTLLRCKGTIKLWIMQENKNIYFVFLHFHDGVSWTKSKVRLSEQKNKQKGKFFLFCCDL